MNILIIGGSGYCGSYLARHLRATDHTILTLDLKPSNVLGDPMIHHMRQDYADLRASENALFNADVVLWFAGKSSVAQAEADPLKALDDNCLNLVALRRRMRPHAYLLYASSASVYSRPRTHLGFDPPPFSREEDALASPTNAYDRSKSAADQLLAWYPHTLGLRMGTVCGWSQPLRAETVFNAMNLSAIRDGIVTVGDRQARRSILFLDDLATLVDACLAQRPTGILNALSTNLSIGWLAEEIAQYYGAELKERDQAPGYSFSMSMTRMLNALDYLPRQDASIATRCAEFRQAKLKDDAACPPAT
jgi:nucleoside-diphosphate-sugar epimerase